jgi:putative addiction module killer protein
LAGIVWYVKRPRASLGAFTFDDVAKGNTCGTIKPGGVLPTAKEYVDARGVSPFHEWFIDLHAPEAARVTKAITRMEVGNFGNVKGVGSGVFEYVLDFGPGHRIYFGKDGDQIIILLGGGTKKGQQNDINLAIERWQDFKRRKKAGGL